MEVDPAELSDPAAFAGTSMDRESEFIFSNIRTQYGPQGFSLRIQGSAGVQVVEGIGQ